MKKVLTLTESELIKLINRIVESHSDDLFNDEDYVEVFLKYFRPWVKKKHGEEVGEYPLSYLVKNHIEEFASDNEMNPENVIFSYKNNLSNAVNVGKNLVKQGKHKLPTLRSERKFTEKFKKPLEFFVNDLNLPDFMTIKFFEENPYNVSVRLDVDWVGLVKHQGEERFRSDTIKNELQRKIENFLGVEIGNPTYGQLKFNFFTEYQGVDEWIKKTLNKEIKKKIKELPKSKILHSVKFELLNPTLGGHLKLTFKIWDGKNDFKKHVEELLQNMGYNTTILKVIT